MLGLGSPFSILRPSPIDPCDAEGLENSILSSTSIQSSRIMEGMNVESIIDQETMARPEKRRKVDSDDAPLNQVEIDVRTTELHFDG